MKKFTLMTLALLLSVVAFAQKGELRRAIPMQKFQTVRMQGIDRKAQTANPVASRRASGELVTLPAGLTAETYYTAAGKFYAGTESGWTDATADMPSVNVAISGSDIYVQGLAYWFKDGWIKGSLEGTTATFPNGQLVGEDSNGPEYLVGSSDGKTVSDIVTVQKACCHPKCSFSRTAMRSLYHLTAIGQLPRS